ncbi:hypothetical protein [Idiomarina sp.]|uniref:hypothetical protein n=1 Tax=Idiomarina sp. TaxID=1874361 RepID=UPI0025BB6A9D|nr:hypothetical protein [Idiomarina sp.]
MHDKSIVDSQFKSYVEKFDYISIADLITYKGSENSYLEYITDNHAHLLRQKLLIKIESNTPFSYVRMGDGEGNCLFYKKYEDKFNILAKFCMDRIWRLMFGRVKYKTEDFKNISQKIAEAFVSADFLGVHTDNQVEKAIKSLSVISAETDVRGMCGVLSTRDFLIKSINDEDKRVKEVNLASCHSHKLVSDFFCDLVKAAGNVSVISCYVESLAALHQYCGVKKGFNYIIPPQALNVGGTPEEHHFPGVFQKILISIRQSDLKGKLFFVAAGILGKIYCTEIKKAGGMAIDVGSMMDVWMGHSVRGYQNAEYLKLHSLIK